MTDEIRTPKGRRLGRMEATSEAVRAVWIGQRCMIQEGVSSVCWTADGGMFMSAKSIADALASVDAALDETIAALLPPGAIVVSEERVRELAKVLVDETCNTAYLRSAAVPAIDRFLSALRAGAQS